MEVLVSDLDGLPEGSVISIRAGSTRRQAPVSALGNNPLRFPTLLNSGEPLKVDLLQTVASKRLVLNPTVEHYRMDYDTNTGRSASFSLRVREESATEGPGAALKQAANPTGGATCFDSAIKYNEAANGARQYLEIHGILPYFQGLLHVLIMAKPENPYRYLGSTWCTAHGQAGSECARASSTDGV
jgi:hypothetical protein